jgi:hypothetical protein
MESTLIKIARVPFEDGRECDLILEFKTRKTTGGIATTVMSSRREDVTNNTLFVYPNDISERVLFCTCVRATVKNLQACHATALEQKEHYIKAVNAKYNII